MAQLVQQEWRNWTQGVVTAGEDDLLPLEALTRGKNSALVRTAPGVAIVATRPGLTTVNTLPITGSPAIIGQVDFRAYSAGSYEPYHLLLTSTGRLDYPDTPTTTTQFDAADATPFTGLGTLDSAVANNAAFLCTGQPGDNLKAYLEGGTPKVRAWGFSRPTVGMMAGVAGGAGSHNGTYELRVTFRNTRTSHRSSISDTASSTVSVTNQEISWSNVPVSADPQVDQRELWVRNTATMAQFYRAGTIDDNVTTTATTSIADLSLIIVAPDTAENDPPPDLLYCEFHNSRMFAVGPGAPTTLLYSKIGDPEAFDPDFFELVGAADGQPITGLRSAHGLLLIFKRESTWILVGDDPASWELRLLFSDTGCVGQRTIVSVEGTTYWWSEHGPMSWDGASPQPLSIARGILDEAVDPELYAPAYFASAAATVDSRNQRILWALPEVGQDRNTVVRPYHYGLQRWEADAWQLPDVASLATIDDGTSTPTVYVGTHYGHLQRFSSSASDGAVHSGTVSSATSTTITDTGASFPTTGNGLVGSYVHVVASNGREIQRRRISANTATQLTVSNAWSPTPNSTFTYIVNGIDFQVDTTVEDFQASFMRKRLRHLFLQVQATAAASLYAEIFVDGATTPTETRRFSLTSGGSVYGSAVYGTGVYGGARSTAERTRLGVVVRSAKVRVRVLSGLARTTLLKVGLSGELLNDNLGRGDTGTRITG